MARTDCVDHMDRSALAVHARYQRIYSVLVQHGPMGPGELFIRAAVGLDPRGAVTTLRAWETHGLVKRVHKAGTWLATQKSFPTQDEYAAMKTALRRKVHAARAAEVRAGAVVAKRAPDFAAGRALLPQKAVAGWLRGVV